MELNGRKVVDVEVEGVDSRDYPDFCDAYFSNAVYEDTGEALTDDELVDLQDKYGDVLWEMSYESLH
jgi:hypothetical protein